MRYRVELVPMHPDIARILVGCRLIEGQSVKYPRTTSNVRGECLSEKLETFLETVLDMNGVAPGILVFRNEIRVAKASLYSWDELLPHIIKALRVFIGDEDLATALATETTATE